MSHEDSSDEETRSLKLGSKVRKEQCSLPPSIPYPPLTDLFFLRRMEVRTVAVETRRPMRLMTSQSSCMLEAPRARSSMACGHQGPPPITIMTATFTTAVWQMNMNVPANL